MEKENTEKKMLSDRLQKILLLVLTVAVVVESLFLAGAFDKPEQNTDPTYEAVGSLSIEGYQLEQVLVLSRHNIRSPLSGNGSVLGNITPHQWFDWSSNPSELSLRGGVLETEMGQFFRKWLEDEGMFPENYQPDEAAVRIYANSKQRTIATAIYFASGLLPSSDSVIETHMEFDQMDPVFTPQLTFVSPSYNEASEKQIRELYEDDILALEENYRLLADVIDLEESPSWKDGSFTGFRTDDTEIILEVNKEPAIKGSLKTACSISDALVLQYFEESDHVKAAFGHELTEGQWKQISVIKDIYGDVLFSAPLIASNVAHPLLREIESELKTEGRKFTFLCGHDSNITSVLAALGVTDYQLPGAIEKTPIGCKVVICRWRSPAGEAFISVNLVYQTTEQLQDVPLLDLQIHPAAVSMQFKDLRANEDGLYDEREFMELLAGAIKEYDRIVETYQPSETE